MPHWHPLFLERAASGSDSDDSSSHQLHKRQQRRRRTVRSRRSAGEDENLPLNPVALAAVGAVSVYCGLKGAIQGYQLMRRRNLRHLVKVVAPVLDDLGVEYWADFGTLLGMYREKDIILHDNDADIVVLNPDWDALLAQLKAALPGYKVFFVVPSEDKSIRWIRVLSGVGVMDLYGGYGSPGDKHVGIPQGHGDLCDIPSDLVFPLATMKFKGAAVSVPGDVPGVLQHRYGETFMIPRYMDKGRDSIEQGKAYARLLGLLGKAGLRV